MNIKKNGRQKRAALLAVEAAAVVTSGVVALGLGINSRTELEELQNQEEKLGKTRTPQWAKMKIWWKTDVYFIYQTLQVGVG